MHIQQKTIQVFNGVFSGVLDIEYFEKNIFGHFLTVLGLIKSEDLSEQKMTKLLKGGIVFFLT